MKHSNVVVVYDGSPGYPRVSGATENRRRPFFSLPAMSYHNSSVGYRTILHRWQPLRRIRYFDPDYSNGVEQMDVALPVVGRYLGFPDSTLPEKEGNSIRYGKLQIPVTSSGFAYSPKSWRPYRTVEPFWVVSFGTCTDSVLFEYWADRGRKSTTFPESAVSDVSGKIVFLHWNTSPPFGHDLAEMTSTREYCDIVESLLNRTVYTKIGWLSFLLNAIVITFSVVVVGRYRLWLGVPLTLFVGLLIFGVSVVSVLRWGMILDGAYPLLASWLCALAFPVVRLVHECGSR